MPENQNAVEDDDDENSIYSILPDLLDVDDDDSEATSSYPRSNLPADLNGNHHHLTFYPTADRENYRLGILSVYRPPSLVMICDGMSMEAGFPVGHTQADIDLQTTQMMWFPQQAGLPVGHTHDNIDLWAQMMESVPQQENNEEDETTDDEAESFVSRRRRR